MSKEIEKTGKNEMMESQGVERTRNRKVFVPKVDIADSKDAMALMVEMPGVDVNGVQLSLEKGVLTIDGQIAWADPDTHELYAEEFSLGDYHRAFTLGESIDQDKIEAQMSDGVLKLILPKIQAAKPKQISVKAG